MDIESIKSIVEYFEKKTKSKIIEFLPLNYNDNDLKLIITLIINMGYSASYVKGWSYEIMGKIINKICNSFSFDDEHPDKEWEYNGVDIEHFSILATTWNLKDSLTPDKIEYQMERADKIDEYSMFRIVFQKIYQYGYSIANIEKNRKQDEIRTKVDKFLKMITRTPEEDIEFENIYKQLIIN